MTTILLVEDNEMNRDMLCRRLKRRGFTIMTAANGTEGLATVQASNPDVVLLDMSLPVMDGWEVARRIREGNNAIPIIGLSAHAMDGDRQKALAAGCNEYESKPIDFERLITKIETLSGTADSGQPG
jgi:CheY-like chemotaxis protein